jgi:hypothetical protein
MNDRKMTQRSGGKGRSHDSHWGCKCYSTVRYTFDSRFHVQYLRGQTMVCMILVYYEGIKEHLKRKTDIWVSVWWKTKKSRWGVYTTYIYWVVWETGTPKDIDEVTRREVSECDVWVCVLEVIGVPSRLRFTRKTQYCIPQRHSLGPGFFTNLFDW